MYKTFSLHDIMSLNTQFFQNIQKLCSKRKHQFFKSFLQDVCSEAWRVYFFESNKPVFRIYREEMRYRCVDEQEKVDVLLTEDDIQVLHNFLKDTQKMRWLTTNKTLLDTLLEQFREGAYTTILDKPFVVYDIETTYDAAKWGGLRSQVFEIAYSISSTNHALDNNYHYIDAESAKRYCDYLLEYDGRIIGYNQIGFDNPVLVANAWYAEAELAELNRKSIDPFLVLRKLTGRRLGLDAVASALIWSGKSLSSWQEGQDYLEKYKKTGNKNLLEKVKAYCKNDVKITLGVILYLLAYQKVQFDSTTHTVDPSSLLTLGWRTQDVSTEVSAQQGFVFS